MYKVMSVFIEDGVVVESSFFSTTDTIKSFIASRKILKKVRIHGFEFKHLYITHGDEENCSGWAFIKTTSGLYKHV